MARRARRRVARPAPDLRVIAPCYETLASGYYRVLLPLKVLLDKGAIQAVWKGMLPKDSEGKLKVDDRVKDLMAKLLNWANVYFLEREERGGTLIPIIEKAKRLGKTVVMDIDDHVVAFPDIPCKPVADWWEEKVPDFLKVLGRIDLLITTTPRLATVYRQYMEPGSKAISISNYVDTHHPRWQIEKPATNGRLVIGWMGGPTHRDDLELLREPLKVILKQFPNTVFKYVGLEPEWIDELPQTQVIADAGYTNLAEYPAHFVDFDIGLIPLIRNEFNDLGKSDLKYLEYSMFGFPSVVSNVPAYQGAIHRKRGFLVQNTTDDWLRGIRILVTRQGLRHSMGLEAKAYVERHRSIHQNAHRWATAFREALTIRRRKLRAQKSRVGRSKLATADQNAGL